MRFGQDRIDMMKEKNATGRLLSGEIHLRSAAGLRRRAFLNFCTLRVVRARFRLSRASSSERLAAELRLGFNAGDDYFLNERMVGPMLRQRDRARSIIP